MIGLIKRRRGGGGLFGISEFERIRNFMKANCKYATFRVADVPSESVPLGARSVGWHEVPARWTDNIFRVGHVIFFWGIRGAGVMRLGDRRLEIGPNTLGVLLPGELQCIEALDEAWEYCWWTVDGPLAKEMVTGFGFGSGVYRAGAAPTLLIKELMSVIQRPGRRHELEASAIAMELICQAARYSRPERTRQIEDPLANRAVDIILRDWNDSSFGVDKLANQLETHRSSLSRRFKRATGSTVVDYISSLRMHHAAHLLRHTEATIEDIANDCGFSDANYFSKRFSARYGKTPSNARKGE